MKLKVVKFGGTSLKSVITREYVYAHIKKYCPEYKIILVVSAMGRYPHSFATDTLLSYANERMGKDEKAWLASIGEQYSALRVSSELAERGYRVKAISPLESGIISDDNYEYANVEKLEDKDMKTYLQSYDILVVGGFIAVSSANKITTLGRGGSDYSAVLFAKMLGLDEVDIYSDVDGVYDKDPNLDRKAKKFKTLTYDQMLNLKSRVLDDRCVDFAKENGIKIYLKGTFSENDGTCIQ